MPHTGFVSGTDFCGLTQALFITATSAGGACAACPAATGDSSGCAVQCPGCVNAFDNYAASCASNFTALNYEILDVLIGGVNASGDCNSWLNQAARPYAAALCGGMAWIYPYTDETCATPCRAAGCR